MRRSVKIAIVVVPVVIAAAIATPLIAGSTTSTPCPPPAPAGYPSAPCVAGVWPAASAPQANATGTPKTEAQAEQLVTGGKPVTSVHGRLTSYQQAVALTGAQTDNSISPTQLVWVITVKAANGQSFTPPSGGAPPANSTPVTANPGPTVQTVIMYAVTGVAIETLGGTNAVKSG